MDFKRISKVFVFILLVLLVLPLAVNSQTERPLTPSFQDKVTTEAAMLQSDDEETLPEFNFLPPLGLDDAMKLIGRCIYFLDDVDEKFLDYKKQRVTEALTLVIDYMKLVDERHSTLEKYRWYFVGKNKVSRPGIDEDVFEVFPPLQGVSAISFVADRGDVHVHRMTVTDTEGNETKFTIERRVREDLPRKEVCFLYYQQEVKKITLYYSTKEKEVGPRLRVYCGVTPMPEYAKEAIYFLTRAKLEISQNNIKQSGLNMRNAWKRMLYIKGGWFEY
jgi:hypothetical protein